MSIIKEGILKYLYKNAEGRIKSEAIRLIKRKFKLTEEKATQYYEEWRKEYMSRR